MKFSCQQCSTAYTVPDEKVRGKRVRIKCKKCGEPIVVEGPAETVLGLPPPAVPAPRPIKKFQQTQVGGLVAPPDLSEKIAAAKAAAVAPGGVQAAAPARAPAARAGHAAPRPAPVPAPTEQPWTVAIDRQKPSQLRASELVEAFAAGRVTAGTLVWKKGFGEWKPVFEVPELAEALTKAGHSAAGIRTPVAPIPDISSFDDEDEATRVVDSSSFGGPAAGIRAKAKMPPPPLPIPKAPRVVRLDHDVATSAAPVPADHGFDDEGEATKVIDPARAQELLSAPEAAPPLPPPPNMSNGSFGDGPGVLEGNSPAGGNVPSSIGGAAPPLTGAQLAPVGEEDEEDVTQVATASAARELLEKRDPGVTSRASPPEPTRKPAPGAAEPLVVVSEEARAAEAAVQAAPRKPTSVRPPIPANSRASFNIHNEPTRIVNVRSKTNKTSLIIGLVVVIVASAAGGYLASQYVPERNVPTRSP